MPSAAAAGGGAAAEEGGGGMVDAALLLDRLVSANSSDDVRRSLQQILQALVSGDLAARDVVSEPDVLAALLRVFGGDSGGGDASSSNNSGLMVVEGGSAAAARIYLSLMDNNNKTSGGSSSGGATAIAATLLTEPDAGRLLETAIDVASATTYSTFDDANNNNSSSSTYPRVLALQLLRQLALKNPRLAQQQLLSAPNGLHRLGDLLNTNNANTTDEQVRNEAVLLATCVAEWAAVAKVWMFSEVGDAVSQTALAEGGLTGGNVTVLDCLTLLQTMFQHSDAALADLVFQSSSPVLAPNLARLMDLRGGQAFLRPAATTADDDDLDDLIASESDKKPKKKPAAPVPKLTASEEKVIGGVLDILSTVLEHESVKLSVWKQHDALASLVWEMALLTPPTDPTIPYPCAVPSIALQQRALQVVATYFDSVPIMERHTGLDRLLYIVCTGGRGTTLAEKMALSQSALHVIRRTLTDAVANEMLMHTLAPPMDDDDGGDGEYDPQTGEPRRRTATTDAAAHHQQKPTVVQKLLQTAFDNLQAPAHAAVTVHRKVALAGSLSALALFLTDEPRRSIMLRLTTTTGNNHSSSHETTTTLLDTVLQCLVTETSETADDFIPLQLLRFLGQWVTEAPMVVQALLSSSHAVSLSVIFTSKQQPEVSALTGLLLGLCMEYMSDESQCGGWTRSNLLELIQQHSVAKFTTKLEALKAVTDLPWSSCTLEWQIWQRWYEDAVLVVRKRVVQELTSGTGAHMDDDDDGGDDAETTVDRKGMKTMQRLVADQATEIEELRTALAESQQMVTSQDKQLATWKQRVESTPTELDDMLNEYTNKNSDLDQKILSLEAERRVMGQKHEAELKARDDTIAALRQELAATKELEAAACEERDSLREDMTALSQAYTSLEDDFRRQTGGAATTETPAGEQESTDHQQPEGEESHQAPSGSIHSGSTEVATLRAENARLRQEAQAADDWMTMAVDRMQSTTADIASLQQEVSTLTAQLAQANAASLAPSDEAAQILTQETEVRMRIEHELAQTAQNLATVQSQSAHWETQVQAYYSELEASARSLDEVRADREKLQADVSTLTQQLENAKRQVHVDARLGNEVEFLSLRSSVEILQQELADVRMELEASLQREQDELCKRDARIQELESLANGHAADDGMSSRDEEKAQLLVANEAAHDWINKAVEHQQKLSDQIASLTQQNADYHAQLKEMEAQSLSSDGVSAAVERFQIGIGERDLEINHLKETLARQLEQIQLNQAQSNSISHLEQNLIESHVQCDVLRDLLLAKDQEIDLLQGRMAESSLEDNYTELSSQLKALQSELADRDEQLKLLEAEVDELQASRRELLQKLADFESIRIEAGTKEEEIIALRARTAEAEARKEAIQSILDAVAKEKEELATEYDKNQQALEKIASELNQLRAGDLDTTQSSEIDESFNGLQETIKNLELQLVDQHEEATGVIQQWEESCAALQSTSRDTERKLQSALDEKELLSVALNESEKALERSRAQLDTTKTGVTNEVGIARLMELETLVQNLRDQKAEQEEDASSVVLQWQESYNEIEAKLNMVIIENESLVSQLQEAHESLKNFGDAGQIDRSDDHLAEMDLKVKNLEMQLADQEEDANNVVLQWQESYQDLELKLSSVTIENDNLLSQLQVLNNAQPTEAMATTRASSEDAGQNTSTNDQLAKLELQVNSLKEQLADQEEDANNVVLQWQESYHDLELKLGAVTIENESLVSQLQAFKNVQPTEAVTRPISSSGAEQSASSDDQLAELALQVRNLKVQLADQAEDGNKIVLQWQQSYQDREYQLESVTKENETLSHLLEESRYTLDSIRNQVVGIPESDTFDSPPHVDHSGRVEELECSVKNLEERLASQEEEANNVVAQWQQCYNETVSQCQDTAVDLQESKAALESLRAKLDTMSNDIGDAAQSEKDFNEPLTVDVLQEQLRNQEDPNSDDLRWQLWQQKHGDVSAQLEAVKLEFQESQDSLSKLQAQFDEARADNAAFVRQTDRIAELEAQVLNLQEELEDHDAEANNVVLQWQQSYDGIYAQLEAVNGEKEALLTELHVGQEAFEALQAKLVETTASTDRNENDDERVAELKSSFRALEQQQDERLAEAESTLSQWVTSHNEDTAQLQAMGLELQDSRNSLVAQQKSFDDANAIASDEVKKLEEKVQNLHEQLRGREEDAIAVTSQWQETNAAVESHLKLALLEKETLLSELEEARESLESAQSPSVHAGKLAELELTVENLNTRLLEQEEDASNVVMQWQQSYEDVKSQLDATLAELHKSQEALAELHLQLDEMKSTVPSSGVGIEERENSNNRILQLESMAQELQHQLARHDEDAINVVSQWEVGYNGLVSQLADSVGENAELKLELQKSQEALESAKIDETTIDKVDAYESQVRIEELTLLLDRAHRERQALEKQVEDLKNEIISRKVQTEELQTKLEESADPAPRQMQAKVSTLESRICEHLETIYHLQCELEKEKGEKSILEQKAVDMNEGFNFQLEASRSESARAMESLEADRVFYLDKIARIDHAIDFLRRDNASLQTERDELKVRLAEREDELLEASDALQLHLTDQVSGKATDLAANVLREQIQSMRAQANEDHRTIFELRQTRQAAEAEAERLRSDLASLLGMVDNEDNRIAIEQRTMEATESFQRTERAEIECIKKSLSRALEELASARAAEKEVEERAAKASHQAILYEQEVVNTKSDFKFLTQTMDEMRESESARRASLEYRISSLEDEQSVLRRYHSAEMENLRNELSQVNIERNRIFQALKESEKNKEVLLQASARDLSVGGDMDLHAELARLRIERAQLLSTVAEEASRNERRLRETWAAAKASAGADIILERELRVSAEKSLESAKAEIGELCSEVGKGGLSDGAPSKEQLDAMQNDLSRFKIETESLAEECEALRGQLDEARREYRCKVERLTEDCRQAKARASNLERNGRYEAEVLAEVARLQASHTNSIERSVMVSVNPADDDREDDCVAVIKLYDALQKQKQVTEEERLVYFELLAEHDDLLAVLAQQDLLKESLQDALAREGGLASVDAAIQEAEEKAKTKYGKYVRLT